MYFKKYPIFAIGMWGQLLFALSDHPIEPRVYSPPAYVPDRSHIDSVNVDRYRSKFQTAVPDWIQDTVEHELAHFKEHPITQRALRATYDRFQSAGYPRTHYLRRFRIIGERIYAYGVLDAREADPVLRTLARLSDYPGIPDLPNVDFLYNHNDGMPMCYDPHKFWIADNLEDQAPVLAGGKAKDAPYVIVVPHHHPVHTWNRIFNTTLAARCPWRDKKRMACWRGNINLTEVAWRNRGDLEHVSGELFNLAMKEPRALLAALSLQHPQFIDAGFSADINWIPSSRLRALARALYKGPLTQEEHIQYAYLPILDGAMISGTGYEWRLLSQSLVFKPHSPYVAWMERGVQPYVHYVPIDADFHNLIDMILWAQNHDQECEEMAYNGARFAEEHLTIEGLFFYLYQILKGYEACQAFDAKDLLQECEQDPRWSRIR